MKKIIIIGIVAFLTSCLSVRRQDCDSKESFQIGNALSQDVTLHFYEGGKPKAVCVEIYNQSYPVYVTRSESEKNIEKLLCDSTLTLLAGQTALIYAHYQWSHDMALSLRDCGSEASQLWLFMNQKYFIGDSVTVSDDSGIETVLPVRNAELWETWYDEKKFIYYHFWRIE